MFSQVLLSLLTGFLTIYPSTQSLAKLTIEPLIYVGFYSVGDVQCVYDGHARDRWKITAYDNKSGDLLDMINVQGPGHYEIYAENGWSSIFGRCFVPALVVTHNCNAVQKWAYKVQVLPQICAEGSNTVTVEFEQDLNVTDTADCAHYLIRCQV